VAVQADTSGEALMNEHHSIEAIRVKGGILYLSVDGQHLERPLAELSLRLAGATEADQQHIEVSPSRYGIHWSTIAEDVSIDGVAHDLDARRKSA
jgi:hypothetical protein